MAFREVATAYLDWLANAGNAKPSSLRDLRSVLAEPGTPAKRGSEPLKAHVMDAHRESAGGEDHDARHRSGASHRWLAREPRRPL